MKPIEFKEQNFTFKKPEGMTEEQCGDLHAYKGKTEGELPVVISCWEPSQEEIDEIVKTKKIWVWLMIAGTIPPVYIGTDHPFPAEKPEEHD